LKSTSKNKAKDNADESDTTYDDIIEDTPSYDMWKILLFLLIGTILTSFSNIQYLIEFNTKIGSNTQEFTINKDMFLTHFYIESPQGLGKSKLTLYKNQKKIFYIDNHTVYYISKDLYHTWSKTSIHTDIYLHLSKGKYRIEFSQIDNSLKHISITENVIRLKYIFPLFMIILSLVLYFYRHYFGLNMYLVPIVLLIVILGYTYINPSIIFILLLLGFISFSSYYELYNFNDDWDYDDD